MRPAGDRVDRQRPAHTSIAVVTHANARPAVRVSVPGRCTDVHANDASTSAAPRFDSTVKKLKKFTMVRPTSRPRPIARLTDA